MRIWYMIFTEVHRPFFLGGIIFALLSIGLWLLHLLGVLSYDLPVMQARLHMTQMVYLFFPFYFLGFLLTVFPRQMSVPAFPQRVYVPLFICYFSAAIVSSAGLFLGMAWLQVGAVLAGISFGVAAYYLLRVLIASQYPHKQMPVFMWIGFAFGFVGCICLVLFVFTTAEPWGLVAEGIGLYGFLLPTIYAVVYRMVPIFTAKSGWDVVRARFGLHLMLAFSLVRMVLTSLDYYQYFWLADLGLLAVIAHQLWQWRVWRRKPYLIQSILHWALLWFPLAFLLSAATSLTEWVMGERSLMFEQAALHALVVGGFGTLLLGMASRVTLGHSGRPVMTDTYTNILFYAFQIVPVMRVAGSLLSEIWPQFLIAMYGSAIAWLVLFGLWALRFLPMYLQPRVDSRPG